MGPRSENLVTKSVINFRRVTHFGLCLLETQVPAVAQFFFFNFSKVKYLSYPLGKAHVGPFLSHLGGSSNRQEMIKFHRYSA